MGDASIDGLEMVWHSVSALCASLSEDDWQRSTACPGWTVQDQVAHLIGPEAIFLGRPQPTSVESPPPYVRNEVGKMNEAAVEYRREWATADVLGEFDEVTAARLEQLHDMTDEEFDEASWTPTGPGTYRDLLAIRLLDCWVHEQDIREAVDRPGHVEGPVSAHVLGRMFLAMPYVVGKKAAAADGSVVRFEVSGPTEGTLTVGVSGGRGKALSPDELVGVEATATVLADFLTYTRVCAGRREPEAARAAGEITQAGDVALAEAVVRSLPFMI